MRTKILHLTVLTDIGGAENQLLSLLSGIDRGKYEHFVASFHGGGKLVHRLSQAGIAFFDLKADQVLMLPFRLRKIVRENQITIIHAYGLKAQLLCALSFFGSKSVKVLAAIHDVYSFDSRFKLFLMRLFKKKMQHSVFVSKSIAALASTKLKIPPEKSSVIVNAVAVDVLKNGIERTALRKSLDVNSDDLLILTVANLKPVKGHQHVLRAIPLLGDLARKVKFCFVGLDFLNGALQRQAREMGVSEKIIFAGFREDIPQFLNAADIFLLPSLNEGLPLSLLEAATYGLPIIATDVGGIPEIITDRVMGLLIPPQSPQAIAAAIRMLVLDQPLRGELGRNAAGFVKKEFDLNRMVQQYEKVYKTLAAEN